LRAFSYDPLVSAFNVSVNVNNGNVTLDGKVDNLKAKNAAERDAQNTVGVSDIRNNITVEKKVIVRENISVTDEALQKRAEAAIIRSDILEIDKLAITIISGIANVTGTVDSKLEKRKATNVLEEIIGIIGINNELSTAGN